MNNISIKGKLQIASIISILVIAGLIAAISIYSVTKLSNETISEFSKNAYEKKREELKNYISLATETVQSYYDRTSIQKVKVEVQDDLKDQSNFLFSIINGEYEKYSKTMPEEELKERIRQIVKSTRYGQSGYFWINDTDAVIVMHPIKPQLDGKNLYEYKDKGGKQIFKEFAAVAKKNGDGFVDYVWPKPGFEKPQPKVSYVKLFEPYDWVIGTGEYVDNVSEKMQKEALLAVQNLRYGQNNYYWVNDVEPKMIMHPIKPQLDGKNLSGVKDPNGKFLFNEMVDVVKENPQGGFVDYMWPKPGKDDPQPKISYVQLFEPWGWIVGTGEYVDNIEEEIIAMQIQAEEEIQDIVVSILILTLIVIIGTYIISSILFSRAVITPLEKLKEAIDLMCAGTDRRESMKKRSNDEIGDVIDSFNKYIDKLDEIAKQDEIVIAEVEDVIQKVNNGFYVYKVHSNSDNHLVQKLKMSINSMLDQTNDKLNDINNTLSKYGASDFSSYEVGNTNNYANGVIGSIINSTSLLGSSVSELLAMIMSSGNRLNDDTNVLSTEVDKLATSANEQAAQLEETAAAIEEITSTVRANVEKVARMSVLANDLNTSASSGQDLANKTTQAMEDIDTQVTSINEAITVIDQIAFQTNILSLNAAVEAATAGEAGKGFAVVAQEVRNLASRSAEAAKEIKDIVEAATAKANEGKAIANNMSQGYSELNTKVNETIGLISDVTEGSKEQETGIVQINDAITSLDRATQVNAASASQINKLSIGVLGLSKKLVSIADRTKYDKSKDSQICDVELAYRITNLKNDHITFKDNSFADVGNYNASAKTVVKSADSDLGKWISEQERAGESFTRSSNWNSLKSHNEKAHTQVQNYLNQNASKASNNELMSISKDVEDATRGIFKSLDQVKADHCKDFKDEATKIDLVGKPEVNTSVKKVETSYAASKTKPVRTTPKPIVSTSASKPVSKPEPVKATVPSRVITANNNDDDEWESF